MEKVCDNCGEEYEVYSIVGLEDQTDICKVCRFDEDCDRKGKMALCKDERCLPCYERSFLSNERSENWDCERNNKMPRDVSKNSHKKYWFKCENDECGHSFEMRLDNISCHGQWCIFCNNKKLCEDLDCVPCGNKSFNSEEKSEFWDYEKNDKNPRDVFKSSGKKYWFKCENDECGHSFEMRLDSISCYGRWCPFCKNQKLCEDLDCVPCGNKSFNSEEKSEFWDYEKNDKNPRDVFKSSGEKYWFRCDKIECGHGFQMRLDSISCHGQWCPFCNNKKLCEDLDCVPCGNKSFNSEEKSEFWDYEKNDKNPRDVFKSSHEKYWFRCEHKHSFEMRLYSISCDGSWCRFCKNKTEKKFAVWLENEKYSFEREKKFDWCKHKTFLPFDFVLEKEKIIIELDGPQHFKQVMNWQPPEITQARDKFKQKKAYKNGYTLIRIPQEDVLRKTSWKEKLRKQIYLRDEPEPVIFICEKNEYDSTHSSKLY